MRCTAPCNSATIACIRRPRKNLRTSFQSAGCQIGYLGHEKKCRATIAEPVPFKLRGRFQMRMSNLTGLATDGRQCCSRGTRPACSAPRSGIGCFSAEANNVARFGSNRELGHGRPVDGVMDNATMVATLREAQCRFQGCSTGNIR